MNSKYGLLKEKNSNGDVFKGQISPLLGFIKTPNKDKLSIDKKAGLISIQYNSGDFYEGQVDEQFGRSGYGFYQFQEGGSYRGTFSNNKFSGYGILVHSNGEFYEGEFKNGYKDGFGRYNFSKDIVYVGYFENGLQNGQGCIINEKENTKFLGFWVRGIKEGNAIYSKKNEKFLLNYEKNVLKMIKKIDF